MPIRTPAADQGYAAGMARGPVRMCPLCGQVVSVAASECTGCGMALAPLAAAAPPVVAQAPIRAQPPVASIKQPSAADRAYRGGMGVVSGIAGAIKLIAAIVFLGIVAIVIAAVVSTAEKAKDGSLHREVANDFAEQYELAKRNGTKMDVCVRAGFVAEGFLQAKDEASYAKWKRIERADCKAAGLRK